MENRLITHVTIRAANQHGLITQRQLDELGVTRHQRQGLVERGWMHLMAPRVYGISGAPASTERRLMLGLLSLGDAAVVSHEAAARLHGFDRCIDRCRRVQRPAIGPARRAARSVSIRRASCLPSTGSRSSGFRCTSATRTIIDLARARIPHVRLEAAIDSAVRSGATAPVVLATRLGELRGPGRWGARRLDELLLDSGGHTILERRFLL